MIRFAPTDHENVAESASEMWSLTGRYSLSVWADAARSGEDSDAVRTRLVAAAEVGGIRLEKNRWCWHCTADMLTSLGFELVREGDVGEPEHHYSVSIGSGPGPLRQLNVCNFLAAFADRSKVQ